MKRWNPKGDANKDKSVEESGVRDGVNSHIQVKEDQDLSQPEAAAKEEVIGDAY